MADAHKPAIKVRYYRFRNRLKEKTAGLAGASDDVGLEIDFAALQKAEALFAKATEDYPDWVQNTLQHLVDLHHHCIEEPKIRHESFEKISRIAHDLKGQGGTFGYPLITSFATSLFRFSSLKVDVEDDHVEIIKAHIDAMRAVIRDRVSGDGGRIGVELARGLDDIIKRYKKKMLENG